MDVGKVWLSVAREVVASSTHYIQTVPNPNNDFKIFELQYMFRFLFPGESEWSGILTYQILGCIFITTMALVLLAAVGYQCTATWKWIKDKTCGDPHTDDASLAKQQAAIRISHSLPDLQTEPLKKEYVQEHKDTVAKKVI